MAATEAAAAAVVATTEEATEAEEEVEEVVGDSPPWPVALETPWHPPRRQSPLLPLPTPLWGAPYRHTSLTLISPFALPFRYH